MSVIITKKNNIYVLLLMLFISVFGFSQSGKVKAEIDTTNIRIGEQFTYKISVDDTEKVIIPKLVLKGLEVVDSIKMDTIKNRLIKRYVLTGFDSGAFYIPRQQIFIKNRAYLTDSILVNVATVKVDTTEIKKFEIKGIKNEPYQMNDFSHLWWVGLIIILLVLFLLYWFVLRKRKDKKVVQPKIKLSPYNKAIEDLKALDDKLLWQNNKTKTYYSELSDIIRVFLEDEFGVPAMESTSNELVKKLSRQHRKKKIIATNDTLNKFSNLLETSDLVKFAKFKPIIDEIQADRKNAEYIINNIKQKVQEVQQENNKQVN